MTTFEDLALDELHALLQQTDCEWQRLLVKVARFAPPSVPATDLVEAFLAHHHITPGWRHKLDLTRIPAVNRTTAERYVATLFRYELAYDSPRLSAETARRAATLFLAPFGPTTAFQPSISITDDLLAIRERGRGFSYSVYTGIFGSTLEQGLFAVDPSGCVGLLFVGDED